MRILSKGTQIRTGRERQIQTADSRIRVKESDVGKAHKLKKRFADPAQYMDLKAKKKWERLSAQKKEQMLERAQEQEIRSHSVAYAQMEAYGTDPYGYGTYGHGEYGDAAQSINYGSAGASWSSDGSVPPVGSGHTEPVYYPWEKMQAPFADMQGIPGTPYERQRFAKRKGKRGNHRQDSAHSRDPVHTQAAAGYGQPAAYDPYIIGTSGSAYAPATSSSANSTFRGSNGVSGAVSGQISSSAGNQAVSAAGTAAVQSGTAAATGGTSVAADIALKAAKKVADQFQMEVNQEEYRAGQKKDAAVQSCQAGQGSSGSVAVATAGFTDAVNNVIAFATTAVSTVAASAASMVMPLIGLIGAAIMIVAVIIAILASLFGASGTFVTGHAKVSPEVEFYRPYLEKYAALYPGMEKHIDLMLAMIMQEAGGEPWIGTMDGDIMQSSESAGYPGPGYLTGEASIAQGVKYLATEVFNRAGILEDPYNMDKIKLALQGYNFGPGYITWALDNYGGYSETNAAIFSDMMAARLGWSAYGDKLYVPHVLRYFELRTYGGVSTDSISHAETAQRLAELSATWPPMDPGRQNVISKGCTLVGYTTYDMYGEDTRSGKDLPRTLDCSSFVAWAFQKSGYTDVPYWSTTGTFLSASNFRQINAGELIPGDIGLINWVGSGGSNHVGIYVGKDSAGNRMWLHCTSHTNPGSSVVTGPRISYYSAFSLFFRYTGFQ